MNEIRNTGELLSEWIEAFNAHDVGRLAGMYSEEAVNFQVAAGEPVHGRENIRADFEAFFGAFPDTWARVENLLEDGDWAAWEWEGGGTFTGEFLGSPPTGKGYTLRGCGFFRFEHGLIVFQRGYWDKLSWFGQVGLEVG
ncbi:MAG: ester cyclase [Pyrinomonadaceae bacterium]